MGSEAGVVVQKSRSPRTQERVSVCGELRMVWPRRGIDHRDGKNPVARNFRGSLLWLFSAVLCTSLTWPNGTCSSTNPLGAADGAHLLVPGFLTAGERQSNPPSAACPAESIKAPVSTHILKTGGLQLPAAVLFSDCCLKTLRNPTFSAQALRRHRNPVPNLLILLRGVPNSHPDIFPLLLQGRLA